MPAGGKSTARRCIECKQIKGPKWYKGAARRCIPCARVHDETKKALKGVPKAKPAPDAINPDGYDPMALYNSVEELGEYASKVHPDAPDRLRGTFSGMREAAVQISKGEHSGNAMWNQMHRQYLHTLQQTYGSQTLDVADRIWGRIQESAKKAADKGW